MIVSDLLGSSAWGSECLAPICWGRLLGFSGSECVHPICCGDRNRKGCFSLVFVDLQRPRGSAIVGFRNQVLQACGAAWDDRSEREREGEAVFGGIKRALKVSHDHSSSGSLCIICTQCICVQFADDRSPKSILRRTLGSFRPPDKSLLRVSYEFLMGRSYRPMCFHFAFLPSHVRGRFRGRFRRRFRGDLGGDLGGD